MKRIGAILHLKREPVGRMTSRFSPLFEKLEDRTMLSATVDSPLLDRVDFHLDNDTSARHGVAISNITTGESIVINTDANNVYGTSSTIKLGVLYTLLRQIDADGNLSLNTVVDIGSNYGTTAGRGDLVANEDLTLRELAEDMIDTSDNWAANRLMDFVEDRYDFNNDTWGAPGMFPTSNAEFASLGLNSTRLDRYNTGAFSPSAHGLAGPGADYRAGFDNEATPSEIASLLAQIHENNGLLSASSYTAYWEILNLNPFPQTTADYRDSPSPDDDGIVAGTGGSGNWQNLMTFYTKSGSNTWNGNVGDFLDDPTIGSHFQRSEAGRVELANGEILVYGIFADESNSSTAHQTTRANIGYEFAVEFTDPFISFTPSGAELDDGRVLTMNMANFKDGDDNSADDVEFRRSGIDLVIDVNSEEVYRAVFSQIDLMRVLGSSDDDNFIVDFAGGNPVPPGMIFDGDAGTDTLDIQNSPTVTYTPNPGDDPAEGTLNVGGSAIAFAGFEFVRPVDPVLGPLAAGPLVIDEGDDVMISGSFIDPGSLSSHTLQVDWGDGSTNTIVALTTGDRDFQASHTYLDDNPTGTPSDVNPVTVSIIDNDNLSDSEDAAAVTVSNLDPVIADFTSDATFADKTPDGEPVNILATFTDVGIQDTHEAIVDWGDGTVEMVNVVQGAGFGTVTGSHVYAGGGIFTITVTLTDDDTGSDQAMTTAVVSGVGLTPAGVLEIIGTGGNDRVTIAQFGALRVFADFLAGRRFRAFDPDDVVKIVAYLCGGDDHFVISSNVRFPAIVHGGAGDDFLKGGRGPTVLAGEEGDDRLIGGYARDILIGGLGADLLLGGLGQDLLIGGTTTHDANDQALMDLMTEWNANDSYATRVDALRNGTGATGIMLAKGVTVFDDGDPDRLVGAFHRDWFFFDPTEDLTPGRRNSEAVN